MFSLKLRLRQESYSILVKRNRQTFLHINSIKKPLTAKDICSLVEDKNGKAAVVTV
jgi:hypothetical protein